MKASARALAFLLACAACVLGGRWLSGHGGPQGVFAGQSGTATGKAAGDAAGQVPGGERGGRPSALGELPLPQTRTALLRKLLAKASTPQLWDWLRDRNDTGSEIFPLLIEELVDRQGWQAWDLALADQDPDFRSHVTNAVLSRLAVKDPWKAYEIWKQMRGQFGQYWAIDVNSLALRAAVQTSAVSVVEVLRAAERDRSYMGSSQKFPPGFDYRTVVDYLNGSGKFTLDVPYNLIFAWTQAAPQQAAQWLVEHPEFVTRGDQLDISPRFMVKGIASMPEGTPGRAEALALLAQMPGDYIKTAWETYPQDTSGGKYSPAIRSVAASMGQEDAWLPATLAQTQFQEVLDPSWQQLPAGDRAELLEKAQALLPSVEKLSPIEQRARARWVKMVRTAWGL